MSLETLPTPVILSFRLWKPASRSSTTCFTNKWHKQEESKIELYVRTRSINSLVHTQNESLNKHIVTIFWRRRFAFRSSRSWQADEIENIQRLVLITTVPIVTTAPRPSCELMLLSSPLLKVLFLPYKFKTKKKLKWVSTKCLQHHQCEWSICCWRKTHRKQKNKSLHTSSSPSYATECPKKMQDNK